MVVSTTALAGIALVALGLVLATRPTWLRVQRHLVGGVLRALALRLAAERSRPAVAG